MHLFFIDIASLYLHHLPLLTHPPFIGTSFLNWCIFSLLTQLPYICTISLYWNILLFLAPPFFIDVSFLYWRSFPLLASLFFIDASFLYWCTLPLFAPPPFIGTPFHFRSNKLYCKIFFILRIYLTRKRQCVCNRNRLPVVHCTNEMGQERRERESSWQEWVFCVCWSQRQEFSGWKETQCLRRWERARMSLSWEMCQAVMVIYTFVFGMTGPLKVRTLPSRSFETSR